MVGDAYKETGVTPAYTLRRRKRHGGITLSVHEDGAVLVTAPKRLALRHIETFVRGHASWIHKALSTIVRPQSRNEENARAHYLAHKEAARALVTKRLAELNTTYGFSYRRIAIRRTKTRWGSCSAKGCLNFDYRILFLPPHLQNYLLVHELCHLRELNHSKRFWSLVAKTVPNYRAMRAQLRSVDRASWLNG